MLKRFKDKQAEKYAGALIHTNTAIEIAKFAAFTATADKDVNGSSCSKKRYFLLPWKRKDCNIIDVCLS